MRVEIKRKRAPLVVALGLIFASPLLLAQPVLEYGRLDAAILIVFAVAILVMAGLLVLVLVKLLDSRPALVLGPDGLLDNVAGSGLIPWTDITGFRRFTVFAGLLYRPAYLAVDVIDPDAYFNRRSALRRLFTRADRLLSGTPISIPIASLSVSGDELVALCEQHLVRYGRGEQRCVRHGHQAGGQGV